MTRTEIIVTVRGGVVQHVSGIPAGVIVTIHDYDVTDPEDPAVEQDDDGDLMVVSLWQCETDPPAELAPPKP